jgi:tetratricopeptide (TPR) repeat protein
VKGKSINALLNGEPVIILGTGGIGKTSLALSILHDDNVIAVYKDRYFISCDGIIDFDLLLTEFATVLRIPQGQDQYLKERILQVLLAQHTRTLLCIDNLETLWEVHSLRSSIESFLATLSRIPNTTLLVTMRGSEKPGEIVWASLHSLTPLNADDTMRVFKDVTGLPSIDQFGKKLLDATGGLPLAVTLLAHLAQAEGETTEDLWNRWQKMGPLFFSRDDTDKDRRLSLLWSVHLSLSSPRLQTEPSAPQLLALLAMLPDGFSAASNWLDQLQNHLSPTFNVLNALHILKKTALVYTTETAGTRRYQLLPPIRQVVLSPHANINVTPESKAALSDLYVQLVMELSDYTDPHAHLIITPELLNIHSILLGVLTAAESIIDGKIYQAAISYSRWRTYLGSATEDIILLAADKSAETQSTYNGVCLTELAEVYIAKDQLEESEQLLLWAASLHQEAQETVEEGYDRMILGELYMRQDRLKEAETSLLQAVDLHKQAHHALSEGSDRMRLGELYMRQDRLKEAETSLLQALDLHKQAHGVLSEGTDRMRLGELYMRQDRFKEAETSLLQAVDLHKQAQSALGEGNDQLRLGELYMCQGRLEEAEVSLLQAVDLSRRSKHAWGESTSEKLLGKLRTMSQT